MKRLISFALLMCWSLNPVQATEKSKDDKPFLIGAFAGQLGNRMFQIATVSALAWDHGAEPCFPSLSKDEFLVEYQHMFFRCHPKRPKHKIEHKWKDKQAFGYRPIEFQKNMKIHGFFQNEKYFAHHRERLLKLFAPHPHDLAYVQKKYQWILEHPYTVGVHLRYYQREVPDSDYFIQYDREYFEKAMALFPESSLFVVASDNLAFARQEIPTEGKNVVFIEGEFYYIDFLIQSLCKHNIISNSTFSWWAAWLNRNPDKIVVRPAAWLGTDDIGGPDDWIKIEARGMLAKKKF